MHKTLSSRIIGYVLSLLLTAMAVLIAAYPESFPIAAIWSLFALAIAQFAVQSTCFLHVFSEKGPRWNLVVFISTLSIVLLIIVFTIWVMHHLDYNMMMMHH